MRERHRGHNTIILLYLLHNAQYLYHMGIPKHTYNALIVATSIVDILAEFSRNAKRRIGRVYQEVRN